MQISVIVPLLNEEESLPELAQWIARVMEAHAYSWEVIFVDDGSRDKSWEVVQELHRKQPAYKGIKFRRNYGKSAALNELYEMIVRDGLDMVSGWKKRRHDPIGKTIPSKFFNWITARITGIKLHDFNCGLKAYRRDVVKSIEVYGEMHRYIPQIAKTAGFYKIGEKVVEHRARKFGYSKFGWERFMKGFLDLTSIMFVSKFGKKPMHLFGTLGFLSFLTGGVITVWLIIEKIIKLNAGEKYRQITDQPLFYIALVAMIVGVQLFVAGFLGELISRNSPDRNAYQIDQRLGDA